MSGWRLLGSEAAETKEPFNVRCDDCDHHWTAAYTPMELGRMANLLKGVRCPMCGASSQHIFPTEDTIK